MLSNVRTSGPAIEPVTLDEMDQFLRGDDSLETEDSGVLQSLIVSAREYVEFQTRRALITQTWTLYLDHYPKVSDPLGWWDGVRSGSIEAGDQRSIILPISPLQSVTSLSTFDTSNNETLFPADRYYLNITQSMGEVILNNGVVWPTFTRNRNGIKIVYVAGYGDLATDVPGALRTAIKLLVTHWYENREFTKIQSDMNQASAPLHVQSLLNRYTVKKL